MKLGNIQLASFQPMTSAPQEAASAISALSTLVGATIKPVLYVGEQLVDGVNYWFIGEESMVTLGGERRLILFAINHCDDEYELVAESVVSLA